MIPTPHLMTFDGVDPVKLRRYAELLVRHGMNVQPGQPVNISVEIFHIPFARILAAIAYEAGALHVSLDVIDQYVERLHLLHATDEGLRYVPRHYSERWNQLVEAPGACIRIVGMEDPEIFSGIAAANLGTVLAAKKQSRARFYDTGINRLVVQWCVAAAATPAWAARVFPTLSGEEAYRKLWDTLFTLCRVDDDSVLERWAEHDRTIYDRATTLNGLRIKSLRFRGPGTDLTVGLSPLSFFGGGSKLSASGVRFTANLPTEEVFTTPDCRLTEGTARVTRPVVVNGRVVKGLQLTFKGGRLENFEAQEGRDVFASFIDTDPGARFLGEVALVGIDSPVYRTGILFEEILLDENATCHIAIGSAYRTRIRGADHLSEDDLRAIGCNDSRVHTDFMISSEEVDVVATVEDGSEVALLTKGEWVI